MRCSTLFAAALAVLPVTDAKEARVSLWPCADDYGDTGEMFEYTEMAFVQHVLSGLTLVADGDRDNCTSVSATSSVQRDTAQWVFNATDKLIHAFRDSNRCLASSDDCQDVVVKGCDASDKNQLFPTFFPDFDPHTRKHNEIKFMNCHEVCKKPPCQPMCLDFTRAAPAVEIV